MEENQTIQNENTVPAIEETSETQSASIGAETNAVVEQTSEVEHTSPEATTTDTHIEEPVVIAEGPVIAIESEPSIQMVEEEKAIVEVTEVAPLTEVADAMEKVEQPPVVEAISVTPLLIEPTAHVAVVAEPVQPEPVHHVHINVPEAAHDEFDWSLDKRSVAAYSKEQRQTMEKVYDSTFKTISESELLKGAIVGISKTDVIVNIGFKSDGMISLNEFRDVPDLKIGDEIEVMVVEKEDKDGHLQLSRKLARSARSWQQIVDFYKTGEVVTGTITSKTKGGLIVDVYGLETFLPGSQIDVKPVTDYDQYVGKTMDFKVVKINETIRNAVVSHKALIESDIEQQRSIIIGQLEKGQVLEGTVKNVTDFGAFIDLGGVDGLLYITDISWGRVMHPNEVLHNGQKLNVVVLDFDDEKKRISLGLKQLTPHPWDNLSEDIKEGSKVKGKVVNIEDYGAFLEILPGVEGLVHVSEISWSSQPVNAKEYFKLGEEYEALVVTLDKDERKMSLSIKQMTSDPWDTIELRFPADSKHEGTVKNITPYGVFVELETGIGGMIHISDLSWIKRYNHPGEFVKVGDKIDIAILAIDKENRKLSLGHKQLEEDPWNTFESVFPIGSIHEGLVTKKDEKGATIQLQYGLEAYSPARHLRKIDGENAEAEETLPFMIIEFDRNDKRIMVSHTKVWEQQKNEEKEAQRKEAVAESEKTKKVVKTIQNKVEKSTLGDIGSLAAIKEKMKKAEEESESK